jgi:phosphate-selective porin OprO/OprP
MANKEMVMHVGLSGLSNNYSIGTATSSQTDTNYDLTTAAQPTQRGTMSSFRSAGRGLSNVFRGQIAGEACHISVQPADTGVQCASEFGASVKQKAYGLEGIFATGPFKLMGEYSQGDYKGSQGANRVSYDTKTYFLEAGYFITGEKYADSYKGGVFSSFKPKNEFDIDKGKWGAIELALRAEGYDVDDVTISGGRVQGSLSGSSATGVKAGAKTYTAGIRWILNPNLVLKGNFAQTNFDNKFAPIDITSATAVVDRERLLMFRTQYMF